MLERQDVTPLAVEDARVEVMLSLVISCCGGGEVAFLGISVNLRKMLLLLETADDAGEGDGVGGLTLRDVDRGVCGSTCTSGKDGPRLTSDLRSCILTRGFSKIGELVG